MPDDATVKVVCLHAIRRFSEELKAHFNNVTIAMENESYRALNEEPRSYNSDAWAKATLQALNRLDPVCRIETETLKMEQAIERCTFEPEVIEAVKVETNGRVHRNGCYKGKSPTYRR